MDFFIQNFKIHIQKISVLFYSFISSSRIRAKVLKLLFVLKYFKVKYKRQQRLPSHSFCLSSFYQNTHESFFSFPSFLLSGFHVLESESSNTARKSDKVAFCFIMILYSVQSHITPLFLKDTEKMNIKSIIK